MANYGNIRVAFSGALKMLEDLKFSDYDAFKAYSDEHDIRDTTKVIVNGKVLTAGDAKKLGDPKKLTGMSDKIDKIEKGIAGIEDPEQRENAELVLSAAKKISDPNASAEEKKAAFAELAEAGLVQKNAGGTKIYVDTSKTGLFYKVFGDKTSPKELIDAANDYGIDDVPKRTTNAIDKKAMTGAKLFGDKKDKMKVETSDKGVTIDGVEYHKQEVPSLEKMTEVYGSEEEAKKAIKEIEKYNKIVEETTKALSGSDGIEVLSAHPDTPPTTPENRKKLRDGTVDIIADGFESQFKDKKMNESQKKILAEFKSLKDIEDPEEYDRKLMEITGKMMDDDFLGTGAADVVEMVSYARELNKGNLVYMPAASNFPLGDIVSMSPEKIDYEKDSPEEIRRKMQLIHVGVEKRSIKKGAGGASASGEKTNLSEFKSVNGIPVEEVTKDVNELSNKEALYKEIFDGDTEKAHNRVKDLAKKYGMNLEDEAYITARDKSVTSAIEYLKKKNPDIDEETTRKNLTAYYDLGKTYEKAYNDSVSSQLFTNEVWTYDKKAKTAKVDRTDGINSIAYLKFEFNVGFGKTGRPSNALPTRFKNKEAHD